ncbi:hypothetical protein BpHYR1_051932 [Brachionus plicatilis]|uniref:Uncharacterized protein n=1 Tax=Brachionus plicatilis TaxID=10195 RepID=A0A3M7SHI0_BRAPC|nr:hypothetical protein BpHYR1_051932 [Brachionus plicatilis]
MKRAGFFDHLTPLIYTLFLRYLEFYNGKKILPNVSIRQYLWPVYLDYPPQAYSVKDARIFTCKFFYTLDLYPIDGDRVDSVMVRSAALKSDESKNSKVGIHREEFEEEI